MKMLQYKVNAYGLEDNDKSVLKAYLTVFNLGLLTSWEFSEDESSDVVFIDFNQNEGKEFVYGCQVGLHRGKLLVSVGDEIPGCKTVNSLARPLEINGLRKTFDNLVDSNGKLAVRTFNYNNKDTD